MKHTRNIRNGSKADFGYVIASADWEDSGVISSTGVPAWLLRVVRRSRLFYSYLRGGAHGRPWRDAGKCAGAGSYPIYLSNVSNGCLVRIGTEEFLLPPDEPDSPQQRHLEARITTLAAQGAEFLIAPTTGEVPYRCVGGLIFLGQKLGVRVGFVSEPLG
jgi:hypothetical protein